MSKAVSTQVHSIDSFKGDCALALKSGLLPKEIRTTEQAVIIALKGREIGVPMMQAFSHIHIINGKPTISAELMLSLIFRNCPGAQVHYVETSSKNCTLEAARPGGKPSRFSFSIEDAQMAGLLNNPTWKRYPSAMLRARAISVMARALFPDAIMGCSYTPEELGANVTVTEDGAVTVETTARIIADAPGEDDGHGLPESEYRVPSGTYSRRSLQELGLTREKRSEVSAYIDRQQAAIESGKKERPDWWDEFVTRTETYFAELENQDARE